MSEDDDPVTSALRRIQVAHLQVRADLRDARRERDAALAEVERLRREVERLKPPETAHD